MSKPNSNTVEKSLDELKKEWQAKYGVGNCRELISEGKSVFIFDPSTDFTKMKAIISARKKGVSFMVDSILNNCWIHGDEELKKDEAFKTGIETQVDEMIDVPEADTITLPNGNWSTTVKGITLELRKAGRGDIRFAEEKNPDNKPIITQAHLLERIAVDQDKLKEVMKDVPVYFGFLFEVFDLKDKKYVEIKKF